LTFLPPRELGKWPLQLGANLAANIKGHDEQRAEMAKEQSCQAALMSRQSWRRAGQYGSSGSWLLGAEWPLWQAPSGARNSRATSEQQKVAKGRLWRRKDEPRQTGLSNPEAESFQRERLSRLKRRHWASVKADLRDAKRRADGKKTNKQTDRHSSPPRHLAPC